MSQHDSNDNKAADSEGLKPKPLAESPGEMLHTQRLIAQWQQTAEGIAVLQREHERVRAQLKRATVVMPCDTVFQPRPWFNEQQLRGHGAQNLFSADGGDVLETLPLPPEPADLLLLPHDFEFCADPQKLLRWAETVLGDGGWMMITGFRPAGLLASLFGLRMGKPWVKQSVSSSTLRLWLNEAGFKVTDKEIWRYSSLAPTRDQRFAGISFSWLSKLLPKRRAHGYLVVARKISLPATPQRERWATIAKSFSPVGATRTQLSTGDLSRSGYLRRSPND